MHILESCVFENFVASGSIFFFVWRVVFVYVVCFVGCELNLWLLSQKSTTNFTFTIIFTSLYMNGAFSNRSVRVFFELKNLHVNVLPPCKISVASNNVSGSFSSLELFSTIVSTWFCSGAEMQQD